MLPTQFLALSVRYLALPVTLPGRYLGGYNAVITRRLLIRPMSTLVSVSGNLALCKISRLETPHNLEKPRSPNEGGEGQERGSFPRHMIQRGEDEWRSGSLAFSMFWCSDAVPALNS